jgi:SAM-dependent methyltransferase
VLDVCRTIADGDSRCRFVNARVTSLPLKDESVDVVTLRSVVIYVPEKQRAFDELFRVLKPGGRLSLFVPTIDEALDRGLSPAERQRFEAWLRPHAEAGDGVWRMAHGYLVATKVARSEQRPLNDRARTFGGNGRDARRRRLAAPGIHGLQRALGWRNRPARRLP